MLGPLKNLFASRKVSTPPVQEIHGIKIYTIEGKNMSIAAIVSLVSALLPVAEEIASHYIFNPESKHKLTVFTGDLNTITQVAQAIAAQTAKPAAPVAVPAA